jgi:transposase-like protein
MKNPPALRRHTISIVQRGQIVQRVIVDGWTSDEVAAAFNVPKRLVEAWVADYRRYGMASLREDAGQTVAAELIQLTLLRPVRAVVRRVLIGLRGSLSTESLPQPLPLRHSNKDSPR